MKYQCPKCKSAAVKLAYPEIHCFSCGWSEPLIDFPMSWDWHRQYSRDFGLTDPGPCKHSEPPGIKALQRRLKELEEALTSLTPRELKRLKLEHIYSEVQDIRQGLRRIDRIVAHRIQPKLKTGKSRGVEL